MSFIQYEVANGIGHIRLNRPEKYNAFVREMALAMQDALDDAAENEAVRCVLISAEGKAFCAGQDLREFVGDNGIDVTQIVGEHYNPIVRKIADIAKPVVCAVNGVAAGAGANLALACDIVIAGKSASFIQAFSKIGLIPDTGGTYYLPRLIGVQRALAYMMTAEPIAAEAGAAMGMIYKAVEDSELVDASHALASKLAAMPTAALGMTKLAINKSLTNDLHTQLEVEGEIQAKATETSDFNEGVAAFLEKRKPQFSGK